MKKAFAFLSIICLVALVFVSCNSETKLDDTITVRFNASDSRSLSVSNQSFVSVDSTDLQWYYHGWKMSDGQFTTGQSGSNTESNDAYWTKLDTLDQTVEFSQGLWNFKLKALRKRDNVQLYSGETNGNVLLSKANEVNTIQISVSPFVSGEKGTLKIDSVYIDPKHDGSENVAPNKLLVNGVEKTFNEAADGKSISFTELVEPGTYTVEVKRIGTDPGIVLASASKTVVVYSGLTTTIRGSVEEDTTTGTFVPQPIKPEGTETVPVPETGDAVVVFLNVTPSMEADKSTTVTIPSAVVSSATSAVTLDIVVKDYRSVADYSFNVATGKGVAASISLTMKDGDTVKTNFDSNKVTVETYIGTGLSGVTVKYNGTTGGDPAEADTNYDPVTGKLTFKTTHFSEFYVEADKQAGIGDKGYVTLQAAVDAAEDGNTVILLVNVDPTQTLVVSKKIILDMNGKTISNTRDIWNDATRDWSLISVRGGNLTVNGNGSLNGKAKDCYALDVRDGGNLVIENGTFIGNIHAVYVREGSLLVNGGEYSVIQKSASYPDEYVLNCYDSSYKNGTASIVVKGGKFHGFNPANCRAEDAGTSFIVDWYSSKNIGTVSEAIYEVGSAVNDKEITISSVEGLKEFARLVNESGKSFNNQTIKLVRDIDLNNEEWTPIGQKAGNKFAGVFDGNNKTISGLYITENNIAVTDTAFDKYVGLFGAIAGGTVKNLTVLGSVKGINAAGIVARMDSGTIEDCISNVTVVGTDNGKAGGIVCLTNTGDCRIVNCVNNGRIYGQTIAGVGGIVAYVNNNTRIENCTNTAEIGSTNDKYSGGIAGFVTGNDAILIERCTNTKSVTAKEFAGGIVGTITGVASITDCSNSGAINAGENGNGGGIAGSTSTSQSSNITGCGNTASVHGKYAGGVIGVNGVSTITNCSGGTADITSPKHEISFKDHSFKLSVEENKSSGRIIGAHQGAGVGIYTVLVLDDTNGDSNTIPTVGICGNTTTSANLKISSGTFYGDPLAGNLSTIILEPGARWGSRDAETYKRGGVNESSRIAEWTCPSVITDKV